MDIERHPGTFLHLISWRQRGSKSNHGTTATCLEGQLPRVREVYGDVPRLLLAIWNDIVFKLFSGAFRTNSFFGGGARQRANPHETRRKSQRGKQSSQCATTSMRLAHRHRRCGRGGRMTHPRMRPTRLVQGGWQAGVINSGSTKRSLVCLVNKGSLAHRSSSACVAGSAHVWPHAHGTSRT